MIREIQVNRSQRKIFFGWFICNPFFISWVGVDHEFCFFVAETLHADMANAMERLNGHPVSTITVTDDGLGSPYGLDGL